MQVYILRHAQSLHNEWFIKRLYSPWLWFTYDSQIADAVLSIKGIEQAGQVKEKLNSLDLDLVICSPLTRAIKTMQIAVGERKLKTIITPLIRERCNRLADTGISLSKLEPLYKDYEFCHFDKDNWWENQADRETSEELKARVLKFKEFLKTRHEKHVLIVTHGNFIRELTGKWLMISNCGLVKTSLDSLLKLY